MAKANKTATKTEIFTAIAEETQLTRKQVSQVFDALMAQIEKNLGKRGPGVFALPGLVKIEKKAGADVIAALEKLGHKVSSVNSLSAAQAVGSDGTLLRAVCDPRGEGKADAF